MEKYWNINLNMSNPLRQLLLFWSKPSLFAAKA